MTVCETACTYLLLGLLVFFPGLLGICGIASSGTAPPAVGGRSWWRARLFVGVFSSPAGQLKYVSTREPSLRRGSICDMQPGLPMRPGVLQNGESKHEDGHHA